MTNTQIKTAMILAAGFGKRMRPLTDDRPKPMVEIAGKPMIDHVLERLAKAGIEQAVVNLHYKADVLENHLKTRKHKPQILLSDERDAILNTGGGVKRALSPLGEEPFILHNSDSVWIEEQDNLARLIASYDSEKMDCLLLLADSTSSIGYDGKGDFFIEKDGRLRRRQADEICPNVFIGASIMHPRLFKDSPDDAFSINILWDRAIEQGRLFGIPHIGKWMHVGTPEAIKEAEEVMLRA